MPRHANGRYPMQQSCIQVMATRLQRLIDGVALHQTMSGGGLLEAAVAPAPSVHAEGHPRKR
ncbi:MAG: hypothetical protein ABIQ36_07110 [Rhodanobacter sp.]